MQRGFGDFGKGGQVMRLVFLFLTLSTAAMAASDCERAGNNPVLCNDGEVTTGVDPLDVDAVVLASNE
jgi:hypothetical protein